MTTTPAPLRVPTRVRFTDKKEIRMGSPYAVCRVALSGAWVPELPDDGEGFQDLKAWSQDKTVVALIQWQIDSSNEPGFRILAVSLPEKLVFLSPRIRGCCNSLTWQDGAFLYRAFTEVSGSFSPTAAPG